MDLTFRPVASLAPCPSFAATDDPALVLRLVCRLFKSSPILKEMIPNKHRAAWTIANLRARVAHGTKNNEGSEKSCGAARMKHVVDGKLEETMGGFALDWGPGCVLTVGFR